MNRRRANTRASLLALLTTVLVLTLAVALAQGAPVRSVILMIGDGMGPQQVKLAEIYKGEPLVMQTLPVQAAVSTRSANNAVTDSAAAATALATGYKTNNGMIGMTPDGQPRQTILEAARAAGKATGTVTTVHPGHATPASFTAHALDRDSYEEILAQVMDAGLDVIFGGGRELFLPRGLGGSRRDGRNLIKEAQAAGYRYVTSAADLAQPGEGRLLGLFAQGSQMAYEIDRHTTTEPSLAQMTAKALEVLSSDPDGFFVMIEGGKIDTAGHDNDTATNVREVLAFDEAIAVAVEYVKDHPDTLLLVTADHETGGLSLTDQVNIEILKGVKRSGAFITQQLLADRTRIDQVIAEYTGITDLAPTETVAARVFSNEATVKSVVRTVVNKRAGVTWSTGSHTGVDVPLFAFGAGSELFAQSQFANTDLAHLMAQAMGISLGNN